MIKFVSGFLFATVVYAVLLYSVKMPEYITYDCTKIDSYEDVPDHVIKACMRLKEREEKKWLRV